MTDQSQQVDETAIVQICAAHGDRPDRLIEIFHQVQHDYRFVPEGAVPVIARRLNLSRAEVYGVLSFYPDFRRTAPGATVVKLCRAEACQSMRGRALEHHVLAEAGIDFGQTTPDGSLTLEAAYCFGNCALAPSLLINDTLHGRVTPDRYDALRRAHS
ncbi:MAG TPA: NAD(P)H-dependent oxidoreductase subunit E [Devosia sp.]|nr:NAD(P)H-dependent oxidoreductase subunit E [Devosia sp.]